MFIPEMRSKSYRLITIDYTKVAGELHDFPVRLDVPQMPDFRAFSEVTRDGDEFACRGELKVHKDDSGYNHVTVPVLHHDKDTAFYVVPFAR